MGYVLKGYVNDLSSFTFDILSYVQEPLRDNVNSLLTFTSDYVSYVEQHLSHIRAALAYVRSLFAMLPILLKELISYVILALVYLRQFIADLPVMLLKWDGKVVAEQKVIP